MKGKVGIGRYDEIRPFYTSDAYEVRGNEGPQWRTVHIGLDIFMPPGTPVLAPLEGIVHSFQDNAHDRDYGPASILEHRINEDLTFFTLYGHLTQTSLPDLRVGQKINAGQEFCQIGPMPENVGWIAPACRERADMIVLGESIAGSQVPVAACMVRAPVPVVRRIDKHGTPLQETKA